MGINVYQQNMQNNMNEQSSSTKQGNTNVTELEIKNNDRKINPAYQMTPEMTLNVKFEDFIGDI